jgi:hypothetical protein
MGGGKSDNSTDPGSSAYETELARQAQEYFDSTSGLRDQLIGDMGNFLSGGFDPKTLPMYSGLYDTAKTGLESQYKVAKDNILSGTPRGGGQIASLTNLENSRANQVGGIDSNISASLIGDLMNKSYGAAFGAPAASMGGMGSASSSYAARQAAMAQASGQGKSGFYGMMGGLGQGAGSYFGGK